jgi:CYTH domain-containing protein
MGIEIERKYLVKADLWSKVKPQKSILIQQAYLSRDPEKTIRIRVADDKGFITIKGPTTGISRKEFEYEIPVAEAKELMDGFTKNAIHKIRHHVLHKNNLWEVDEFKGDNEGLVIAEIELEEADEKVDLPEWIDSEVSSDRRYSNSNLVAKPYKTW